MGAAERVACLPVAPVWSVSRRSLANTLQSVGKGASAFLDAIDLDAAFLDSPTMPITYPQLARLLQQAAEFADCEHLGILLGRASGLSALGETERDILHAPTVRAALMAIRNEFRAQERGAIVELALGDTASLSYIIVDPAVDTGAVISDVAVMIALGTLAELCGPGWSPELVELPHRPPRDGRPYRRALGCPIAFNATVAAIHFKGAWLDRPVASGGVGPGEAAGAQICETGPCDVTDRVIQQLGRSISSGAAISASKVARLFGMCGRTLQRELTKARTSYRSLSDDVRFGMAKRFLRDTDMPVTEIALALGYADVSVLTRAFTRWAGTCPSEWRSSNRRHVAGPTGARRASALSLAGGHASRLELARA